MPGDNAICCRRGGVGGGGGGADRDLFSEKYERLNGKTPPPQSANHSRSRYNTVRIYLFGVVGVAVSILERRTRRHGRPGNNKKLIVKEA